MLKFRFNSYCLNICFFERITASYLVSIKQTKKLRNLKLHLQMKQHSLKGLTDHICLIYDKFSSSSPFPRRKKNNSNTLVDPSRLEYQNGQSLKFNGLVGRTPTIHRVSDEISHGTRQQ